MPNPTIVSAKLSEGKFLIRFQSFPSPSLRLMVVDWQCRAKRVTGNLIEKITMTKPKSCSKIGVKLYANCSRVYFTLFSRRNNSEQSHSILVITRCFPQQFSNTFGSPQQSFDWFTASRRVSHMLNFSALCLHFLTKYPLFFPILDDVRFLSDFSPVGGQWSFPPKAI